MKKEYTVNYIIPISILIALIVVPILIFTIGKHIYFSYQKHEEDKLEEKVHHVLKKKGWENKIKTEKPNFTLNTQERDVEVTFKDEPYNTYQYDVNDDGTVTGDADLKMEYQERFDNDKRYREYRKRKPFEEKYNLK
ncbi:DUF3139 domain-containing protein [Staphylococcus capitis]|uniref:DUF3139 domain-containing protein n=1 Tax=Staphylococcus capitis TaxID=29388 RepID=UPI001643589E|nr:DUF3139 domain-containing protein [Staphylococcus capitis]MBC3087800.1 DUF3139 domain-containing protein [Staphylococcus capitis]MCK6221690.1 DUF3139 domain-containing protein [Staphylococcus capitis]